MTTTLANQLPRINLANGRIDAKRPGRDSEIWTTAGLFAFNSRIVGDSEKSARAAAAQQHPLTSDAARDFRPSHFGNTEEPVGSEFGRELKNGPGNRRSQRTLSEMGTRALHLPRERSRQRGLPFRN